MAGSEGFEWLPDGVYPHNRQMPSVGIYCTCRIAEIIVSGKRLRNYQLSLDPRFPVRGSESERVTLTVPDKRLSELTGCGISDSDTDRTVFDGIVFPAKYARLHLVAGLAAQKSPDGVLYVAMNVNLLYGIALGGEAWTKLVFSRLTDTQSEGQSNESPPFVGSVILPQDTSGLFMRSFMQAWCVNKEIQNKQRIFTPPVRLENVLLFSASSL